MVIAAAGIAEISEADWAATSAWLAGGFCGFLGSAILLVLGCVAVNAWMRRERFGMRTMFVFVAVAAVALLALRRGYDLRAQAEQLRMQSALTLEEPSPPNLTAPREP